MKIKHPNSGFALIITLMVSLVMVLLRVCLKPMASFPLGNSLTVTAVTMISMVCPLGVSRLVWGL